MSLLVAIEDARLGKIRDDLIKALSAENLPGKSLNYTMEQYLFVWKMTRDIYSNLYSRIDFCNIESEHFFKTKPDSDLCKNCCPVNTTKESLQFLGKIENIIQRAEKESLAIALALIINLEYIDLYYLQKLRDSVLSSAIDNRLFFKHYVFVEKRLSILRRTLDEVTDSSISSLFNENFSAEREILKRGKNLVAEGMTEKVRFVKFLSS